MNRRTLHLMCLVILPTACGSKSDANPTRESPPVAASRTQVPATSNSPSTVKAGADRPATTPPAPNPTATPDDWAPSTGKEMPVAPQSSHDPKLLTAQLAEGLAIGKTAKDKATCNRALDKMYPAALGLELRATPANAEVFETILHCARKTKRFQVLEVVARAVTKTKLGMTSDLAHALIGQDRLVEAGKEIATRLKATPDDPSLLSIAARLACKQREFAKCRATAERAIAKGKLQPKDPEAQIAIATAEVNVWQSSAMLGDYVSARAAIAKLPEPVRDPLTKLVVLGEKHRLVVDVEASDQLALGVYHLAGTVNPAPVELTFGNADKRDRELRIEIEIPGVTARVVKQIIVLGKKVEHVALTPTLLPTFVLADVRGPRAVQLDVKVTEGNDTVYERSIPTELLPRDYLPTWQKTGEDSKRPTLHNVGAWVTPNDPAIDAFLGEAKKRLVGKQSFSGPQSATLAQVAAIYDELKARGVSYVMDPQINSDQFLGQRTRLPSEVLTSTNAQCLEGTLLFASLLEALGVSPVIVTVPGHAFVGWHSSPGDGKVPKLLFVETTMVHGAPFENAVKLAMRRVESEIKSGTFKSGASQLIEVSALRKRGITAQPTR